MSDSLLERLKDAREVIDSAIRGLEADPSLEQNAHWRDNLETSAYYLSTSLGTDYEG